MEDQKRPARANHGTSHGAAGIASPASYRARKHLSSDLLSTARHQAALAADTEAALTGHTMFSPEHRAYVLSAIITASAFLEASVNELFQDAADGHSLVGEGYLASLPPRAHSLMRALWLTTRDGRKLEPLEKWEWLLACSDAEPFDRGAQPYEDALWLFRIRNALVHFQPTDRSPEDPREPDATPPHFPPAFRRRFAQNALVPNSGTWWPDRALGAGCALWALETATTFADGVCERLKIRPHYQRAVP